jgi:formylglycine-generating enzyme required for sulfatase activity
MTFVRLPKGTFYMGGGTDPQTGKPIKGVKTEITEDFEIAVHDVTQGQWQAVMGENPSWFSRFGTGRKSVKDVSDEELKLFPVESVSWYDAQEFIRKLNEKERGSGYLYRLLSEVEWEYACRGGATSEEECSYNFYVDKPRNDLDSEQANFNFVGASVFDDAPVGKFPGRTTRVGAYRANKLGLCDMQGNVWQWCADEANAMGKPAVAANTVSLLGLPSGQGLFLALSSLLPGSGDLLAGSARANRGGSWVDDASASRAALRDWTTPTARHKNHGFRLARVRVRPK